MAACLFPFGIEPSAALPAANWVGWVGTYDDIVNGNEGQYRIRIKDNLVGADTAYPGVVILPDGTIVTTTYGHWDAGEEPYIVTARFTLADLDRLAATVPTLTPEPSESAGNSNSIVWTDSATTGTTFEIEYSTAADFQPAQTQAVSAAFPDTNKYIGGLLVGTTYWYRIRSQNNNGLNGAQLTSAWSDPTFSTQVAAAIPPVGPRFIYDAKLGGVGLAQDPAIQGWFDNSSSGGTGNDVSPDLGRDAWQTNGVGGRANWHIENIDSQIHTNASAFGWQLSFTMRMVSGDWIY